MNEEFYDMIESKIKDPSDYHDIREVFNFMRDFCKDNGGHIIPYDRPRQLKIGWLHFETGFLLVTSSRWSRLCGISEHLWAHPATSA